MSDTRDVRGRKALIDKFLSVAAERLERLNNAFVEIERDPDDTEASTLIMREIHTLKGEAKLMGFADVNFVAHRAEDLLVRARDEGFRISPELGDTILAGFDTIERLLNKRSGSASPVDLTDFVRRAQKVLQDSVSAAAEVLAASPAPTVEEPSPASRASSSLRVDVAAVDDLTGLVADLFRHQLTTGRVFQELAQVGEQWRRELQEMSAAPGAGEVSSRRIKDGLDRLQELYRELARLVRWGREDAFEGGDHVQELEATVKGLRLLPLSSLFARYPRAVRDMARGQGKEARVVILGGHLALDKYVLDEVDEPLLHLIRNAVDHGLESPEERDAAGKPREGRIELSARSAGAHVEVVVADDGRGLSPRVIREAAVARGILRPDERPTDETLTQLVFRMGFSTRSEATELSGRGIGLDVVKERVERLGGSVGVHSEPGRGTSVVLTVPISVALRRALVVEVGGRLFAVSSQAVDSVVRVAEVQVERVGTGRAMRMDGELVPVFDLAELLSLETDSDESTERRIAVVQSQGVRVGLRLPRVVGEREFVQRPLDPFLEHTPLLIGVAVLEHREPILVLNVPEILRATRAPQVGRRRPMTTLVGSVGRRILLVEDSELTRDMVEGLLREMGHDVTEAANGQDALSHLDRAIPDLVITDLEMPVMDGFELIKAIRSRPECGQVPIVVFSTRGSEEDRRAAAELGADAYLVKAGFREQTLRETVDRFLADDSRQEGSDG